VFEKRISELDIESRIETIRGKRIFRPKNLHICKSREQSKQINEVATPAIIISSSGMATAGRILHHLSQRLSDPKNTVVLIGYQAHGTRGRDIMEGKESVKIHGRQVEIKAKIESILGFSGHSDYNEILAWLMGFNRPPEKTFLIHGEPEALESMAEKIRSRFGWDTIVPRHGETIELDL